MRCSLAFFMVSGTASTIPLLFKSPFDADVMQLAHLEVTLSQFVQKHHDCMFKMNRVEGSMADIFIEPSSSLSHLLSSLMEVLESLEWMSWSQKDNAHRLWIPDGSKTVINRLEDESDISFDHIAICISVRGRWALHRRFDFTPGEKVVE